MCLHQEVHYLLLLGRVVIITVNPIFGAVAFGRNFAHGIANSGDILSPVSLTQV
jgi:hypothetical protein